MKYLFHYFRYIIPVPVINHFISGVEESGKYVGFCSLGLSCQPTENVQLREHFHMRPEMTGVLVSKINPLSEANKVLRKDDIVLAFDGVPIANDGTGTSINLSLLLAPLFFCLSFLQSWCFSFQFFTLLCFVFVLCFSDSHF